MQEETNNKYEILIDEFSKQRNELKTMITELEKFKSRVDTILPDNIDKRFMRYFEEKIKTVTELFKAILDIRKEITKITKDEFELRRKLSIEEDDGDIDGVIDIKKLADRVANLGKKKEIIEQKIVKEETNTLNLVEKENVE